MITALYHDEAIVVCVKPAGVNAQDCPGGLPELLKDQLGVPSVYPVHRLDLPVGGVMVYALTEKAAASLSRQVQEHTMVKTYLAVTCGVPEQPEDTWKDLLFHDQRKNKTFVVQKLRKGVKEAMLDYTVLECGQERSLVRVRLHTGRTHQIRVQFASRKLPLAGDRRYGGQAERSMGLWSWKLRFAHPVTGEPMEFSQLPPMEAPWEEFTNGLHNIH